MGSLSIIWLTSLILYVCGIISGQTALWIVIIGIMFDDTPGDWAGG
jgi:hypothetical protein